MDPCEHEPINQFLLQLANGSKHWIEMTDKHLTEVQDLIQLVFFCQCFTLCW